MDVFLFEKVVDEVVDQLPETILKVAYNDANVLPGIKLTPTEVKDKPTFVQWDAKPDCYYTLLMTEPDAPSRLNPIYGEIKHWLIVNIPGNKIEEGENKCDYRGSGPLDGSGFHRYVFLVFEQRGKQDFSSLPLATKRNHRVKFNTRAFIKQHSLGKLVAANFFVAQYDEYVTLLHQLIAQQP